MRTRRTRRRRRGEDGEKSELEENRWKAGEEDRDGKRN